MDDYHMYLAPLGRFDSLCAAAGTNPTGLLPSLMQAGLTRNYGNSLPWLNDLYLRGDTAMHLLPDTTYELCLWAVDYDGIVYFQRTLISTHGAPHFSEATIKTLYYSYGIYNNDTINYCFIDVDESTAYYHFIFGTETALSDQGISSITTACQYSLIHHSTLEQYNHQTTEISYMAGTDGMGYSYFATYSTWEEWGPTYHAYYCWKKHVTQSMSPDSVYRIYVIPYSANNEQGIARTIRFSPGGIVSENAEYGLVTECSVSDITANSATLHGSVLVGRRSMSKVGFAYRLDSPLDTEATTITVGPLTDSAFSYRLHGLQPNTTYRYAVAKSYDTATVYSSDIYFNPHTFTTASCTVSTSIDITICYNAYYNNHRYTSSQTLEFTFMASNGCDSLLTVNLTVLPQRIGHDTVVLCYGEEYNGAVRYISITLPEYIHEEGSCDSIHNLRLEVLPQITTSVRDTLRGGSYEWGGEVLTEPGQYTHVFTDTNGCDSTVHLTLVTEPQEGIGDVANGQIHILVDGNTIVISGAEGQTVTIYDASGRMLATHRDGIHFEAPTTGTYLVQLADQPARRVVVVR